MNDFLDREPELNLTEEVADIAARILVQELINREGWKCALRGKWEDEVYTAPEFRDA